MIRKSLFALALFVTAAMSAAVAQVSFILLNGNVSAAPPVPSVAPNPNTPYMPLQTVGPDGIPHVWVMDAFGAATNSVLFRRANGTNAAKAALGTENVPIGSLVWRGYDGSGYPASNSARLSCYSGETWTATATGAYCLLAISPNGTAGNGPVSIKWYGNGITQQVAVSFASVPACNSALEGGTATITDSTTATWGDSIAGGGTNHVFGRCNGSAWTVAGK